MNILQSKCQASTAWKHISQWVLFHNISGYVCHLLFLQYYYNPHTQQYMYWDGEKQTYIPAATDQSNAEGAPMSTAPSDSLFASPGSKEKKDKPKNKTAQQVFYI